eukprot:jgi/Bigna1/139861/aug1.52_g14569
MTASNEQLPDLSSASLERLNYDEKLVATSGTMLYNTKSMGRDAGNDNMKLTDVSTQATDNTQVTVNSDNSTKARSMEKSPDISEIEMALSKNVDDTDSPSIFVMKSFKFASRKGRGQILHYEARLPSLSLATMGIEETKDTMAQMKMAENNAELDETKAKTLKENSRVVLGYTPALGQAKGKIGRVGKIWLGEDGTHWVKVKLEDDNKVINVKIRDVQKLSPRARAITAKNPFDDNVSLSKVHVPREEPSSPESSTLNSTIVSSTPKGGPLRYRESPRYKGGFTFQKDAVADEKYKLEVIPGGPFDSPSPQLPIPAFNLRTATSYSVTNSHYSKVPRSLVPQESMRSIKSIRSADSKTALRGERSKYLLPEATKRRAMRLFDNLDQNADGFVFYHEFPKVIQKVIANIQGGQIVDDRISKAQFLTALEEKYAERNSQPLDNEMKSSNDDRPYTGSTSFLENTLDEIEKMLGVARILNDEDSSEIDRKREEEDRLEDERKRILNEADAVERSKKIVEQMREETEQREERHKEALTKLVKEAKKVELERKKIREEKEKLANQKKMIELEQKAMEEKKKRLAEESAMQERNVESWKDHQEKMATVASLLSPDNGSNSRFDSTGRALSASYQTVQTFPHIILKGETFVRLFHYNPNDADERDVPKHAFSDDVKSEASKTSASKNSNSASKNSTGHHLNILSSKSQESTPVASSSRGHFDVPYYVVPTLAAAATSVHIRDPNHPKTFWATSRPLAYPLERLGAGRSLNLTAAGNPATIKDVTNAWEAPKGENTRGLRASRVKSAPDISWSSDDPDGFELFINLPNKIFDPNDYAKQMRNKGYSASQAAAALITSEGDIRAAIHSLQEDDNKSTLTDSTMMPQAQPQPAPILSHSLVGNMNLKEDEGLPEYAVSLERSLGRWNRNNARMYTRAEYMKLKTLEALGKIPYLSFAQFNSHLQQAKRYAKENASPFLWREKYKEVSQTVGEFLNDFKERRNLLREYRRQSIEACVISANMQMDLLKGLNLPRDTDELKIGQEELRKKLKRELHPGMVPARVERLLKLTKSYDLPLRFKLGSKVNVYVPETKSWMEGMIIAIWEQGSPYRVRILGEKLKDVYVRVDSPKHIANPPPRRR